MTASQRLELNHKVQLNPSLWGKSMRRNRTRKNNESKKSSRKQIIRHIVWRMNNREKKEVVAFLLWAAVLPEEKEAANLYCLKLLGFYPRETALSKRQKQWLIHNLWNKVVVKWPYCGSYTSEAQKCAGWGNHTFTILQKVEEYWNS